MGAIAIPSVLQNGAIDEDDSEVYDRALITVLQNSSLAILDILDGRGPHRIWSILTHWLKESTISGTRDPVAATVNFAMAFNFPLLPAHRRHIEPFLSIVEKASRATNTFENAHYHVVSQVASILFHVVATRFHLRRAVGDDNLIFMFAYHGAVEDESSLSSLERDAYQGQLVRTPTMYEQAYASSIPSVVDTRVLSLEGTVAALRCVIRTNIVDVTPETSPIRAILPALSFSFPTTPTDLGLAEVTPGLRPLPVLPRELRHLITMPPETPRPRPRPVGPGRPAPTPKTERTLHLSPVLTILPGPRERQRPASDQSLRSRSQSEKREVLEGRATQASAK
jgi:hypothetical protein